MNGDKSDSELLLRISKKVDEVKAIQVEMKKSHYELKGTVTEIDHTIRGTKAEREVGRGGMAKQVQDNTEKINDTRKDIAGINSRQNKILIWGSVIILGLNATAVLIWEFIKHKIATQ